MYFSSAWNFSKIHARLQLGQMVTAGASMNDTNWASPLEKESIFFWNAEKVPNKNECDHGGNRFGGAQTFGTLWDYWRVWNALIRWNASVCLFKIPLFRSCVSSRGRWAGCKVHGAFKEMGCPSSYSGSVCCKCLCAVQNNGFVALFLLIGRLQK